jgi:hypothetical protein
LHGAPLIIELAIREADIADRTPAGNAIIHLRLGDKKNTIGLKKYSAKILSIVIDRQRCVPTASSIREFATDQPAMRGHEKI